MYHPIYNKFSTQSLTYLPLSSHSPITPLGVTTQEKKEKRTEKKREKLDTDKDNKGKKKKEKKTTTNQEKKTQKIKKGSRVLVGSDGGGLGGVGFVSTLLPPHLCSIFNISSSFILIKISI